MEYQTHCGKNNKTVDKGGNEVEEIKWKIDKSL